MKCDGSVTIDLEKVPWVEMDILCRTICEAAEAFFEDPNNEAEFQAWLRARTRM